MERMVRIIVMAVFVFILVSILAPGVISWLERHGLRESQNDGTQVTDPVSDRIPNIILS